MDAATRVAWQKIVDAFDLKHLHGFQPWDAVKVDTLTGLSSGEQHAVSFLLGAWDPGNTEWRHPRFDVFDALRTWDEKRVAAFLAWVNNPLWP